jgi:hypothetical protein
MIKQAKIQNSARLLWAEREQKTSDGSHCICICHPLPAQ